MSHTSLKRNSLLLLAGISAAVCIMARTNGQTGRPAQTEQYKSIIGRISGLRSLPDDGKAAIIMQLAVDIRALDQPGARVGLASSLANLATEGDFGNKALQAVADTLTVALKQEPYNGTPASPGAPYVTLAQLVRYEHVKVFMDDPQLAAAMKKLVDADAGRSKADFTLSNLQGKSWTRKSLVGKVVLVNFWATWCPPCRKEIPDLEALYQRFKDKGFIVLGITDEDVAKVTPFVSTHPMSYPVLLDPGRKVNKQFEVEGIPRTLIYSRNGKLAAEAIDMRTQRQLIELLAKAGLK